MVSSMKVAEYVKRWEGFSSKPYRCPAGKLTIGYGRNIQDNPITSEELRQIFPIFMNSEAYKKLYEGITEAQAEILLVSELRRTQQQLYMLDWYYNLSDLRQMVIQDMAYNLGLNGLLRFRKMIKKLRREEWTEAAFELKSSKYYNQVGKRAETNYYIMKNNRLPDDLS